jgi:hypothetical protein
MVAYSCSTPPNEHVTLMPGEALAQVRILPAGASTIRYNPGEVSLISMDHQVSRFEMTGMIPFHQISRFTPFLLGEQFALQDPRQWANMSVYLDLTGVQPDPARSVRGATRATNEQRTQLRRSLGALSDYVEQARGVWIMPCSARYQLFLNGYEVASGEDGRLYLLEMGLVGNEARIVVQFSRVQVDMSEFPLLNLATLR